MTPVMAFVLTFFGLGGILLGAWRYAKWRISLTYPKVSVPLPPEVIRRKIGGCGIGGCPNPRPHSHVGDLARRMKENRK